MSGADLVAFEGGCKDMVQASQKGAELSTDLSAGREKLTFSGKVSFCNKLE